MLLRYSNTEEQATLSAPEYNSKPTALTMIIVLTPAVSSTGDTSAAFYTRLLLFVIIAIYGTMFVAVFNAFWPAKKKLL